MNYEIIYLDFIKKFKDQKIDNGVYTEKHHIIPRYAGGLDNEDNLVTVTYRQHIFLHRVLYAWKKQPQDALAVRLMTGVCVDKKRELCSMAGKLGGQENVRSGHMDRMIKEHASINGKNNVLSGHLDNIRKLAHTESQKEHLSKLCKHNKDSGHLDRIRELAHQANRDREWTDDQKSVARKNMLNRCKDPEYIEKLKQYSQLSAKKKQDESYQRSLALLQQKVVYEEYLHMTPKRQSKYYFVTPTGLKFESPKNMAQYFGIPNQQGMLESWCKKNKHGWYVELKSAQN